MEIVKLDSTCTFKINGEKREKASKLLKCKGKNLSTAVREMLEKYAKEFDKMQKK